MEKATFGAGCFWHVEEAFRTVKGVAKTEVGFMGGRMKNPPYLVVSTGLTHIIKSRNRSIDAHRVYEPYSNKTHKCTSSM